MKKNLVLLLFAGFSILCLIGGCKRIDKKTQFDIVYDETFVIPSSTGINLPFNIITPDIESNSATTFEVNDTRKDLVESIKLKKLTLTLSSPPNGDFSFLKSLSIFLSADGLEETKIAWIENISADSKSLELEVSQDDLKEYIKKDKFTLRLNTEKDELVTSDHHIELHSVFFVDAKILGQ